MKSITFSVRHIESGQADWIATIDDVREAAEPEHAVVSACRVPATLCRGSDDVFRVRNDEVVGWLVAPKELAANSHDAPCVQGPLLWREWFKDHVIFGCRIRGKLRSCMVIQSLRDFRQFQEAIRKTIPRNE